MQQGQPTQAAKGQQPSNQQHQRPPGPQRKTPTPATSGAGGFLLRDLCSKTREADHPLVVVCYTENRCFNVNGELMTEFDHTFKDIYIETKSRK